jgi:hypothetical protein
MAGEWITLRTGIMEMPKFWCIVRDTKTTEADAFLAIYRLAAWFKTHGKQGKMKTVHTLVDRFVGIEGFSVAMQAQGWLKNENGILTLSGFCDVSATRKGLGKKIRASILSSGKCAACGAVDNLVVDHIIPVARGGLCERSNLQALCQPCNISKGKKLPEEWRGRNG